MGVEPPFIYDRPSTYTFGGPTSQPFNPKSATHASWQPKPNRTPKRDGPLIDFNKHPDTYLIVPYGNLNVKPMHPRTKDRVDRARMLQLGLRILALIGALGALFCVIAINNTSTSVAWIIRVAPAVTILHTLYAIHHLCRAASGRTPTTTASYMIFAALMDTGLIPFFSYSAWMAHADYTKNEYGWSTLFNNSKSSYKIILAFFIVSAVEASLVALSLILGIYLAAMFKKIARMPPDMNPLEPNLTSRHKRNKSEGVTEKNMKASGLVAMRASDTANLKRVPYIHTRTDSVDSVTLYGNDSARTSRAEFRKDLTDNEKDPWRFSANNVSPSRPGSAISPSPNSRSIGLGLDSRSDRAASPLKETPSKASSWLSYLDFEGVPTDLSPEANQQLDSEVRPISPLSNFSRDPSIDRRANERENWYQGGDRTAQGYHSVDNASRLDVNPGLGVSFHDPSPKKRIQEPLGMNPPTPYDPNFPNENAAVTPTKERHFSYDMDREVLNDTEANNRGRPVQTSRPSSFVGSGGKSRFYGDLRSSMGSINNPFGGEAKKKSTLGVVHQANTYERTKTMQTESDYSDNFEIYDSDDDDNSQLRANIASFQPASIPNKTQWSNARQLSDSTGHDLTSSYAGLGAEFGQGMGRRREVSGKVAEEGRAGSVSPSRNGAAGWERFKGL
ncbi:hypothetical protein PV10_01859 [Exophiala mesophila]|uniref:Uncharacterized protein n=1 Tax=Exophiala mesophila TaxID=212818 RepID=A0A0D1YBX6_EXOME|nr:uncharacterized protein PV10_01859 [Exophiala mesophila]KIV98181.1 hypothetical protein PV10_01859 [Exophiala mesophila]